MKALPLRPILIVTISCIRHYFSLSWQSLKHILHILCFILDQRFPSPSIGCALLSTDAAFSTMPGLLWLFHPLFSFENILKSFGEVRTVVSPISNMSPMLTFNLILRPLTLKSRAGTGVNRSTWIMQMASGRWPSLEPTKKSLFGARQNQWETSKT